MNRKPSHLGIIIALIGIIVPVAVFSVPQEDIDKKQDKIDALQDKIANNKTKSSTLQDKITTYKETLKARQQEALTLESQLEVLDDNIGLTETQIDETATKIDELDASIEKLHIEINDTQSEVDDKKDQIGNLITDLYLYDQQTYLEVALSNNTLSDYSSQIEYTEEINNEFKSTLDKLQKLKKQLQDDKTEYTDNREDQKNKRVELTVQKDSLQSQVSSKENLLDEVEEDEEKFQALVRELQAEQAEINSTISSLEKTARQTLDELTKTNNANKPIDDTSNGSPSNPIILPTDFSPAWPVMGTVTATFHDPTYPYRRYFQHDAVDIAAPQGTTLRAADSGVVAVVKYDGTPSYAYIMIVHADNFATIYGHTSQVFVAPDQVVAKGEAIGLVGGIPGTPGSGGFTTGSHVHFGVRLNGIPVDPLLYLP